MLKKIFQITSYIFAAVGFVLTAGYFAVRLGITNTSGVIDLQQEDFLANANSALNDSTANYYWQSLPEWQTLKAAIEKDAPVINRAALDAGISPRLLVANLAVEQLRFFFDDRESYKKFFAPLKILGSETQFSWGVMGVKESTALEIEKNLDDSSSPFYLGDSYSHLLDFPATTTPSNIGQERFVRMTDQHDHYWSYLYAALYLRQVERQWRNAGYDISKRPEILATLFNIGFENSHPNADPHSGGAAIPIGNRIYSFGTLAGELYYSSELLTLFPIK